MIHFRRKEATSVPIVANFLPEDGIPYVIEVEQEKFEYFNEVTLIVRNFKSSDIINLDFQRVLYGKYDINEGPWWFLRSKFDEVRGAWIPIQDGEPRLRPELGAEMYAVYKEKELFPDHEHWMRKPAINAKAFNFNKNDIKDADYGFHRAPKAFDDLQQMQFWNTQAIYFELQHAQNQWDAHCNNRIRHTIVIKPGPSGFFRADFTFNRSDVASEPPKFIDGQAIQLTCTRKYVNENDRPVFEGRVVHTYKKTDGDIVILIKNDPNIIAGKMRISETREVYLAAKANYTTLRRHIEIIQKVVETENPTVKMIALNQGTILSHRAQRQNTKKGKLISGELADVKPIHEVELSDKQKKYIEDYYQKQKKSDFEQGQFIQAALLCTNGYMMVQGSPGTGKSRTIIDLVTETIIRGKRAIVAASSNKAKSSIGGGMLNAYQLLPKEIRDGGLLVFLETISTLQNRWDDVPNDPQRYSHDYMGLLDSESTDPDKPEYYELGSHVSRRAVEIQEDPKAIELLKKMANQFINIRKKLISGQRVTEGEYKRFNQGFGYMVTQVLMRAMIVVGTCASVSTPMFSEGLGFFPLVVLDEAAFSLKADFFTMLLVPHDLMVSVGDHKQLAPVVLSENKNEYVDQLKLSQFETQILVGHQPYRLRTNYRMHPMIADFPNKVNYRYGIRNDPSTSVDGPVQKFFLDFMRHDPLGNTLMNSLQNRTDHKDKKEEGYHMRRLAIDIPYAFAQGKGGLSSSICSYAIINMVLRVLEAFLQYEPREVSIDRLQSTQIVVLTPYALEKSILLMLIGWKFPNLMANIEVATIDSYLGSEKEIVLLSLPSAFESNGSLVGFLKDMRRLNTALSRAQHRLFIFGNITHWNQSICDLEAEAHGFALLLEDLDMKMNIINGDYIDAQYEDLRKFLPSQGSSIQQMYWHARRPTQNPTHKASYIWKGTYGNNAGHGAGNRGTHIKLQNELKEMDLNLQMKLMEMDKRDGMNG